jgi:hypothetical protein
VLYAPFAIAAGPGRLWDSLVAQGVRDGDAWRLPFPLAYEGSLRGWPPGALAEDGKDVLGFYLPLIAVIGLVVAAVVAWRRVTPAVAGLGVLALGALAYLLSRSDEQHAQPLLVILCALLPILAAQLERPVLPAVVVGLILVARRRSCCRRTSSPCTWPACPASAYRPPRPRRCPRWWPPSSARSPRASRYTWLPAAPTS